MDIIMRAAALAFLLLLAAPFTHAAEPPDAGFMLVARRDVRDPLYGGSVLIVRSAGHRMHVGFLLNKPTKLRLIDEDPGQVSFLMGTVVWRPGELEDELERGLWHVMEADGGLAMRRNVDHLWEDLVGRIERRAAMI